MGHCLSRRQPPSEHPLTLATLALELLTLVLSHVPPRALVTRCRAVCRVWRDVVDGPSVWLLQLARDRSAQGRAIYQAAQRCPPARRDQAEDGLPLCALARYCMRAPLGRNLIFNPCGERACRGAGGRGHPEIRQAQGRVTRKKMTAPRQGWRPVGVAEGACRSRVTRGGADWWDLRRNVI